MDTCLWNYISVQGILVFSVSVVATTTPAYSIGRDSSASKLSLNLSVPPATTAGRLENCLLLVEMPPGSIEQYMNTVACRIRAAAENNNSCCCPYLKYNWLHSDSKYKCSYIHSSSFTVSPSYRHYVSTMGRIQ
jgi:hypothetical protein